MIPEIVVTSDAKLRGFVRNLRVTMRSRHARRARPSRNFKLFREEINDEETDDEDDDCTDRADGTLPRERTEHIRTKPVTSAAPVFCQRQCGRSASRPDDHCKHDVSAVRRNSHD